MIDSRPRIEYVKVDGTVVPVIHDHSDIIQPLVTFQEKDGRIVRLDLRDERLTYCRASQVHIASRLNG